MTNCCVYAKMVVNL